MKHRPMNAAALLVSASFLLTASAFAQTSPATTSPATTRPSSANVPPPPGMNDPGVTAVAPANAASAATSTTGTLDLKPQALPSMQDNGPDGRDNSIPHVTTHRRGDDVVQEYSRSGQVYMVVVTPKNGIQQTYMIDPQGRVVDDHGQKPTRPVMYKVLEWGKSKPAESSSSDGTPVDDDN